LRRRYPEIFNDLMIFGLADTQGSHLKQNNPRDYHHRLNFPEFLKIGVFNLA